MRVDRRTFLKIAGLSVCALGLKPAISVLAGDSSAGLLSEAGTVASSATAPAQRRWAMVVNLAKCFDASECVDCIEACHRVHNVPDFHDPRLEIKWIWKELYEHAFPEQAHEFTFSGLKGKPIVVLCNHCDNPPCVRVCPTQATWKREDGIVAMDMHRCIGCRYCMVACPYGSRSFNWQDPRHAPNLHKPKSDYPTRTRGVVEKCNFCAERIDKGQIPACVEACKDKALLFGDLKDPSSEVSKALRSHYSIRRSPGLGTDPAVYYIL